MAIQPYGEMIFQQPIVYIGFYSTKDCKMDIAYAHGQNCEYKLKLCFQEDASYFKCEESHKVFNQATMLKIFARETQRRI